MNRGRFCCLNSDVHNERLSSASRRWREHHDASTDQRTRTSRILIHRQADVHDTNGNIIMRNKYGEKSSSWPRGLKAIVRVHCMNTRVCRVCLCVYVGWPMSLRRPNDSVSNEHSHTSEIILREHTTHQRMQPESYRCARWWIHLNTKQMHAKNLIPTCISLVQNRISLCTMNGTNDYYSLALICAGRWKLLKRRRRQRTVEIRKMFNQHR